jgi:hypothetical protein
MVDSNVLQSQLIRGNMKNDSPTPSGSLRSLLTLGRRQQYPKQPTGGHTRSSSDTACSTVSADSATNLPQSITIFTAADVKGRKDVFKVGRGGETNFHVGNHVFRERVTEHVDTYAGLKASDRGRKFAKQLLDAFFSDVTFAVRHSYFFKNLEKGTISQEKILSVKKEHGDEFEAVHHLPSDSYFTVGETWVLGIISDIVRSAAAANRRAGHRKYDKVKPAAKRKAREQRPHAVSDDEKSLQSPPTQKKARASPDESKSDTFALRSFSTTTPVADAERQPQARTDLPSPVLSTTKDLDGQLVLLDDLIQWPLPDDEGDACLLFPSIKEDELLLSFIDPFASEQL